MNRLTVGLMVGVVAGAGATYALMACMCGRGTDGAPVDAVEAEEDGGNNRCDGTTSSVHEALMQVGPARASGGAATDLRRQVQGAGLGLEAYGGAPSEAIVEHAQLTIALLERISQLLDNEDYDAAIRFSDSLFSVDRMSSFGVLYAACSGARKHEQLRSKFLMVGDVALRNEQFVALLLVFRSLEEEGHLPDGGWGVLRCRERSLAPDMAAYFAAGLLCLEGKEDKAEGTLAPLREDSFWGPHLDVHPVKMKSFLLPGMREKRR